MYSSDYGSTAKYMSPSQESTQERPSTSAGLTTRECVELFQEAVDTAKDEYQKTLYGSDTAGEALKPKLTVDLRHRGLAQLPREVIAIIKQDVERLHLAHNTLSTIAYEFSTCSALKYLNLRDNRFKEIPQAIFGLPQLEILDLSRNKLREISNDIENLKALRVFSIQHNNLEDLPDCLGTVSTLRMLKLMGNPLNPGMRRIIGPSELSPSASPAFSKDDNERDTLMTKPIKDYLLARAAVKDSADESSDGPAETPRALSRFPVQIHKYGHSTSGSESASELRSPGFSKPPLPIRSHYRAPSSQGNPLQVNAPRRPGLAPLALGNERNRSNSESVLQATQNNKMKRMGLVTKKNPDLGMLDESRANRNSHHLRGQSHGSALRNGIRPGDTSPTVIRSPRSGDRPGALMVRRLSSLPEHKRESQVADNVIGGARGVLFALDMIQGHISQVILIIKDPKFRRSSLERSFTDANMHIERLDQELYNIDRSLNQNTETLKRSRKAVAQATRACIVSHQHVGAILLGSIQLLIKRADPRYIRKLMLLLYGSMNELANASKALGLKRATAFTQKPYAQRVSTISEIPRERPRSSRREHSLTPTKDRPKPERKFRNGRSLQQSMSQINPPVSLSNQPPVPVYLNGRSRSNSRAANMFSSASSSVVSTPRSGESFTTSSLAMRSRSGSVSLTQEQIRLEKEQAAQFETIFKILREAANEGLRVIPQLEPYFVNNLEASLHQSTHQRIRESWEALVNRSRYCKEMSEILNMRLSTVRLNDAEARNARDFWHLVKSFIDSYSNLLLSLKEARRYTPIPKEVRDVLKPVHTSSTEAAMLITNSPWNRLTFETDPPPPQTAIPIENGYAHHRSRGSGISANGSISSPYNNVPATPLSAALGPAAQATMPAPASASFEDTFQGNIFQRADTLQKQQTLTYRR